MFKYSAIAMLINVLCVFAAPQGPSPDCTIVYVDSNGEVVTPPSDMMPAEAMGTSTMAQPAADVMGTSNMGNPPADVMGASTMAPPAADVQADSTTQPAMEQYSEQTLATIKENYKGRTMNTNASMIDDAMAGAFEPFDMESCQFQAAMCVFYKKNPDLGGNQNTNVDANTGLLGNNNGIDPVHAHGMVWTTDAADANNLLKTYVMKYISDEDHYQKRGYYSHLPLAPKCGCVESMPIVERSDCTEIENLKEANAADPGSIKYKACEGENDQNNDLVGRYKKLHKEGDRPMLDMFFKK